MVHFPKCRDFARLMGLCFSGSCDKVVSPCQYIFAWLRRPEQRLLLREKDGPFCPGKPPQADRGRAEWADSAHIPIQSKL